MASPVLSFTRLALLVVALAVTGGIAPGAGAQQPDASPARVTGRVVDLSGTPVPGALVVVRSPGRLVAEARTSDTGAFAIDVPPGPLEIVAAAPDLASASVRAALSPGERLDGLRLVLGAGIFAETVTVAATAPGGGAVAGSTTVVTGEILDLVPGRALDDVLGMTPGFSLFRRSSSRVANPTAQGVSLRGLAASGASRALVLSDGVPANDPFGGWVYWNRIPRTAIDRVEVARGGRSDRYGADAIGGVVQILTAPAVTSPDARVLLEAGSRGTGRASAFAGTARGAWNLAAAVEAARSGRAPVVAAGVRGPIDTRAGSRHVSGLAAVTWTAGPGFTASVRVNPFGEDRNNGTPGQRNDTRSAQVGASVSGTAGRNSVWDVQAWGQGGRYRQTFTTIAADRASETLTNTQRVESDAAGVRAQWRGGLGAATVAAGVEARQVHAENVEGRPLGATSSAGGRQRGPALFARAGLPVGSRLVLEGGGRWETWANRASHGDRAERRASSFSPRVAVAWRPAAAVTAHASAYRAFRAPTLNELYRGFRVGAISTIPNEQLRPERLTGAEAAIGFTRDRLSLRTTGWWSRVERPVVNVTIGPLLRQRQNVGEIGARGVEAEVVLRPVPALEWTGTASLTRSVFRDPGRPALDRLRVPQVPGRLLSSRIRVLAARLSASVEVRHAGRQYEDDRNELSLSPSTVVDLAASWRVRGNVRVVAGIENVMDREVEVGRTPVPTVGLPRSVHVGVRIGTTGGR
ncbi:MAG TPA: TonB-dependent receptor [Vicinamibacterales bacterium]|nr:TonB-dependent receptor [Vicinamibacterales bacterium]